MKERTRTEYSVLNMLTGLGGYFLNTILGFVCRVVFVEYLSADYLGVNGLFVNVLNMLSLAELGVGSAIVFALYKPLAENDKEKIASLIKIYRKAYFIIGIVIAILGLALTPFLKFIIHEQPNIVENIYILYIINLFNTATSYFFSYRSSLLIAAQMNYVVSGVNYLVTILQSVIQIVFLMLTRNYLLYLLIQTFGTLIYNIVISRIAIKKFPYIQGTHIKELEKKEQKELFKNIRDLMMYKISGLLVNSTDNILITFFKGLAITGVSSNYTLLVSTLNALLGQIFNGLTASIGNHNATHERNEKFEMFNFLNLINFWIFGWASMGIIFCSSDIVKICFGKEYVLSIEIPFIMAVNFFSVGMMNAIWTYKHTLGLFRYGRSLQILTGVLNILFSIVLGEKWGLFGILFATFLARLCTNLWYDVYALFVYGFKRNPMLYVKKYLYYIVVLGIATILCHLTFKIIRGTQIMVLIIKIIVCSIICNGVFLVAFFHTNEFRKLKEVSKNILKIISKNNNK